MNNTKTREVPTKEELEKIFFSTLNTAESTYNSADYAVQVLFKLNYDPESITDIRYYILNSVGNFLKKLNTDDEKILQEALYVCFRYYSLFCF